MKKTISCLLLASLFVGGSAFAAGYRIPVQSVDSTAKAGANVATAHGADAAYYNPAKGALLQDGWLAQIDATYLRLGSVSYRDNRTSAYNGDSEVENYFIPTGFLLSPKWHDFRFGFAVTTPYGLAKRWTDPYPKTFAEKFSVKTYEFNPTLSYAITDKLAIAGGWRVLYATATVMSNGGPVAEVPGMGPANASRAMDGSTTEWGGWNAAIDFQATKEWNLAASYRSNVDLNYTGHATLNSYLTAYGSQLGKLPGGIDAPGNVTIPAPAVLALSTSYTFFDKLTVELTWDRTFWSKYENLDFHYSQQTSNQIINGAFNRPMRKDWDDSDTYRLGFEYAATHDLTLMAGLAYDRAAAPAGTLGFELPDSDAWAFSVGARYAINNNMEVGLGVLYEAMNSRSVVSDKDNGQNINGEFSDENVLVVSAGFQYRF